MEDEDEYYHEEYVTTPRSYKIYDGPKNANGLPDTTGTREVGIMRYIGEDVSEYADPEKKYVGEWKDGEFHGKGVLELASGNIYSGEFLNGIFNGNGRYVFNDGQIIEGEFLNGSVVNGRHINPDPNYGFIREGKFVNGQLYKGKETYANGDVFEGFRESRVKKNGVWRYADGDVFKGSFTFNVDTGVWELNGWSRLEVVSQGEKNKYVYEGNMLNNRKHGKGKLIKDGRVYEGEFRGDNLVNVEIREERKGGKKKGINKDV